MNKKCDCSKCEHWDECEIGLIIHNPIQRLQNFQGGYCEVYPDIFYINKGDKVAQCTLMEHKGYLLGIESDVERSGGFGSTGGIR